MGFKYYSKNRPIGMGTYPKGHTVMNIENYGERRQFDGFQAWGHIEFDEPLSASEVLHYELVDARLKPFYMARAKVDVSGRMRWGEVTRQWHMTMPKDNEIRLNSGVIVSYFFDDRQEAIDAFDGVSWDAGCYPKRFKVKC